VQTEQQGHRDLQEQMVLTDHKDFLGVMGLMEPTEQQDLRVKLGLKVQQDQKVIPETPDHKDFRVKKEIQEL
jgi:hypothetical protein